MSGLGTSTVSGTGITSAGTPLPGSRSAPLAIPAGLVASFTAIPWKAAMVRTSEGRRPQPRPQPVSHGDGHEVERHYDREEQERGDVDHRPRGLDVGRLESDVVNVIPEMHEFPLQVHEGELAVHRQHLLDLHH